MRLETIEGAGRSLIGERPQVVLPLFREFLDATSPLMQASTPRPSPATTPRTAMT